MSQLGEFHSVSSIIKRSKKCLELELFFIISRRCLIFISDFYQLAVVGLSAGLVRESVERRLLEGKVVVNCGLT